MKGLWHWHVLLWVSGFLIGTFLVVTDEILATALYCKGCDYNFPVIGEYPIWHAWELTFGIIVVAILFGFVSLIRIMSIQRDTKISGTSGLGKGYAIDHVSNNQPGDLESRGHLSNPRTVSRLQTSNLLESSVNPKSWN